MVICNIPNTDDPIQHILPCLRIIYELDKELDKKGEAVLDMSSLKWMPPLSSLMLSTKINEVSHKEKDTLSINLPQNPKVIDYLEKIGFPLGGKDIIGTSLPIRHFDKNPNKTAGELFKFVEETFPDTIKGNCVNYLLGELLDNVDQHSEFTHASVMAQFFPQKNMIDIGVIDNGISIPTLFEKNNYSFNNDPDAIRAAIDGLSTRGEDNRGHGLSSIRRIANEGLNGSCYVISRKGLLSINPDNSRNPYIFKDIIYKGTMVYLRFMVPSNKIDIYSYF